MRYQLFPWLPDGQGVSRWSRVALIGTRVKKLRASEFSGFPTEVTDWLCGHSQRGVTHRFEDCRCDASSSPLWLSPYWQPFLVEPDVLRSWASMNWKTHREIVEVLSWGSDLSITRWPRPKAYLALKYILVYFLPRPILSFFVLRHLLHIVWEQSSVRRTAD